MAVLLSALLVRPASAEMLDRNVLHSTFSENFQHFAASDTGLLQGRPVWQTTFKGGLRSLENNHEAEWYGNIGPAGPFHVSPAGLDITAKPQPGLPGGLRFVSGLITTEQSFSQTYGYFEICAELPAGRGLWPAFWLLPADGSWPPEIDAMEMLGDTTTSYYASIHAIADQQRLDLITRISAPDLSAGFHVFGVAWRPDGIRFYLDNVLVHQTATPADMNGPMYLLANLAVGGAGSWPGQAAPDATGVYRIAWIKAWQFNDLAPPAK